MRQRHSYLRIRTHLKGRSHGRARGFTLIEASLAIMIIGIGVVAAAQLLLVGTRTNADAHRLTTAMNLAVNCREMAYGRPGTEVLALDGQTISPPIDARNTPIAGLEDWEQRLSVSRADPNNLTFEAGTGTESESRLLRLAVDVYFRGRLITSEQWLLADTVE